MRTDKLRLEIPRQTPNPTANALAHPVRLKAWLAALPLGNANKTGHELLAALHQLNRAQLPVQHREALMREAQPRISDLVDTLHKQYGVAPTPLPERAAAAADMARALLTETAYGYKAVILELAATPTPTEATRAALVASAYQVIAHLSRLLVESYSIYAPEPKKLWLEINQLYRYAERNGFHASPVGTDGRSIEHAYRSLLLLALANPYHLLQGEALQVYEETDHWAQACRLLPLNPGASPKGHLYIDLDADAPPRYAPSSFDLPPPADGRSVELAGVLPLLEQRIKEVILAHRTEAGQLTLLGRKLRSRYKRLAEAWGIRSERLADRRRRSAPVAVAAGISACHHFTSGGAAFEPEAGEIELRRSGRDGGSGLTLIAADETPWLSEDEAKRLATGIVQPRTSQFAADQRLSKDVWVKVFSTQAHYEHQKGEALVFESMHCQIMDESRSGLAIECVNAQQMRLNVGEVVAFNSQESQPGVEWSIGTIRWLRLTPESALTLGIRALADDALAVAVRGIRGAGKGGEYFRALLIPRLDPIDYPTSLITPAAIYDVDSVVLINTGERLLYAHLTRLMEATDAYSLFQFQIVPPPEGDAGPHAPSEVGRAL